MDLALAKRARDVLNRHLPFPVDDAAISRYDRVATGSAKFVFKTDVDAYPKEDWSPNRSEERRVGKECRL